MLSMGAARNIGQLADLHDPLADAVRPSWRSTKIVGQSDRIAALETRLP